MAVRRSLLSRPLKAVELTDDAFRPNEMPDPVGSISVLTMEPVLTVISCFTNNTHTGRLVHHSYLSPAGSN